MRRNLARSIIDIQNQINSIDDQFESEKLNSIIKYNTEIQNYLLENIDDELIRLKIKEIPIIRMEDFKIRFDFIGVLVSVFSGNFDTFNNQKFDYTKAKEVLNEIKNKYAHLEKLLDIQIDKLI